MPTVSPLASASVSPLAVKLSVSDIVVSVGDFENVTATSFAVAPLAHVPFSTCAGAPATGWRLSDAVMSVLSMSDVVPFAMAAVYVPAAAVLVVVAGVLSVFSVVVVSAAFSFLAQPSSIAIIATAASMQTPNRIQVDFVML